MTTDDPRIEAAAKALYEAYMVQSPAYWDQASDSQKLAWLFEAERAIEAADAVDPLRQITTT